LKFQQNHKEKTQSTNLDNEVLEVTLFFSFLRLGFQTFSSILRGPPKFPKISFFHLSRTESDSTVSINRNYRSEKYFDNITHDVQKH
jgi:hypothetical protein